MPLLDLLQTEHVASYLTLTFLEIVLAGDNLVLISILAGKLPEEQRPLARRIGLLGAVATRLLLLVSLFWLSHLETPLKISPELSITPRQIVFAVGGTFLVWKALAEISTILNTRVSAIGPNPRPWRGAFALIVLQIALFDIIFSLDSVIAAIGIAKYLWVMVAAILTATAVMFVLVNPISNFIDRYQVVKLVSLNLLVVVGAILITESGRLEIPHGYFYVAGAIATAAQAVAYLLMTAETWQSRFFVRAALFTLVLAVIQFAGVFAVLENSESTGESIKAISQFYEVWIQAPLFSLVMWVSSLVGSVSWDKWLLELLTNVLSSLIAGYLILVLAKFVPPIANFIGPRERSQE